MRRLNVDHATPQTLCDRQRALARLSAFAGWNLESLTAAAARMTEHIYRPGTALVRAGWPVEGLFLVRSGYGHVVGRPDQSGRVGPGSVFGEASLLDEVHLEVTIMAVTHMTVDLLTRDALAAVRPFAPARAAGKAG